MKYRLTGLASVVAVGAAAVWFLPGTAMADAQPSFSSSCKALAGQTMGDLAIGSARIQPETVSDDGAKAPAHCLVEGAINEREGAGGVRYGIGFQLALPREWNGRFLLMGGGGLNGSIKPPLGPVAAGDANALSRGFAVVSHDSGHKGEVFDASFYADQRAALDFAESSVRTVTLATREIVAGFYGKAPHHSYMTGCSTGGREGMLASQRYPELFDGIVVGAPAMRPGHSNLAIEHSQVLLNRTLPSEASGPAGFSPLERDTILSELRRQCDAKDGLADGMIMNVAACRGFDPSALQCKAGQTDGCIAKDKVEALKLGFAGPVDAAGRSAYAPMPWDTGIVYQGPGLPGYLPSGQPGPFGPATSAREIDIDARLDAIRHDAVGRLTDTAYWTNLSTYLDRGGKMIFFHGVSDPWFSALDTWDYFQRAGEANGERWDDAARFYMVPGMMHCSGGNSFDNFDLLGALVDWVENGHAPSAVTATRKSAADGATRICPYPQYARFEGGDPKLAESYSCTGQ